MATVLDICLHAGQLLGVFDSEETLDASDANRIFASLQSMYDSWSTERLFIYAIVQDILTLTPSQASYTVGPTALVPNLVVASRPMEIQSDSFIRMTGNVDYPLTILTPGQYRAIVTKSQPTSPLPMYMMYDTTFPLGTLYFWPVPSAGTVLYLYSMQALTAFTALTQTVSLPPGYQRALEYSLAEEISSIFSASIPAIVARTAAKARSNIKRINYPDLRMGLPNAVLPQTGFGYYDFQAF